MTPRPHAMVLMSLGLLAGCAPADDSPGLQRDGDPAGGAGAEASIEASIDTGAWATSGEGWVVDFEAYGPIPLGVDLAEAVAASDGRVREVEGRGGCIMIPVIGGPDDVFLMVVEGRVVRVDVRNERVKTRAGAGIGDAEERVRSLYPGAVEVQPHKYTDGHYLVVTPPDGSPRRLIFETDGELVLTYRAGVLPEVSWVEGCS